MLLSVVVVVLTSGAILPAGQCDRPLKVCLPVSRTESMGMARLTQDIPG